MRKLVKNCEKIMYPRNITEKILEPQGKGYSAELTKEYLVDHAQAFNRPDYKGLCKRVGDGN
jgi:hypothetical protein